ncbi:helix-turn-helix domain-containing protein [Bradyrhizobium sp. 62B]|uniref:helix-turn-helix domain-containing protein n=1 Tax=Bradyrhizobium sp. 62B TaxID=2898442 RepID=UPI001B8A7D82|nr:helix-turn-helix domain-containing protein [Bradyrhizobium diazoefficiens]MBR0703803.1 helix-turn-helix domain-containing protein [Bradyrhizobium diazoefficiens]MBR0772559.1 helix-turn-helix domain-containing protein [Bradyrhizobium diazoefficiens]WIW47730.1 helix-turn-helix domain-containing protein [Bradyrhizobium sp. 62B]
MDLVFTTEELDPAKRFAAWQDAICDHYVHVDVNAVKPADYQGFIREAQFGPVTMSDVFLSEQRISRRERHIAKLDKDCYYVQFLQQGSMDVLQAGQTLVTSPGIGAIFSASDAYDLECSNQFRSLYLEIPRKEFSSRFAEGKMPLAATIATGRGLGRIAAEFCALLAAEASSLEEAARGRLGHELMDVLALALDMGDKDEFSEDATARNARLRSVKAWIEEHLTEPDLSLEKIARANGVSLRHLHYLFRSTEMSVSEWILNRRLQRCYDALMRPELRTLSVTEIAYRLGFSSSSHFSTVFRRKFGHSPSELRRRQTMSME